MVAYGHTTGLPFFSFCQNYFEFLVEDVDLLNFVSFSYKYAVKLFRFDKASDSLNIDGVEGTAILHFRDFHTFFSVVLRP